MNDLKISSLFKLVFHEQTLSPQPVQCGGSSLDPARWGSQPGADVAGAQVVRALLRLRLVPPRPLPHSERNGAAKSSYIQYGNFPKAVSIFSFLHARFEEDWQAGRHVLCQTLKLD